MSRQDLKENHVSSVEKKKMKNIVLTMYLVLYFVLSYNGRQVPSPSFSFFTSPARFFASGLVSCGQKEKNEGKQANPACSGRNQWSVGSRIVPHSFLNQQLQYLQLLISFTFICPRDILSANYLSIASQLDWFSSHLAPILFYFFGGIYQTRRVEPNTNCTKKYMFNCYIFPCVGAITLDTELSISILDNLLTLTISEKLFPFQKDPSDPLNKCCLMIIR